MEKFIKQIFVCILALGISFNHQFDVFAAPIPKPPNLKVTSYIIMDFNSGAIIASKNNGGY